MIAGLKNAACRTARATGLFKLTRSLSARMPRIIMYHGFCGADERFGDCTDAASFRRQLTHIRRHFRPIKLSELGRRLSDGGPLPDRAVAITVDDGYANFARWAAPLLAEFDVPATLFVVSDFPGTGQWLWTDKFKYLHELAPESPVLERAALGELKRMTASERDGRLADLSRQLESPIPERAPPKHAMLGWRELRKLSAGGLVEIGAHTRDHPILAHLSSEEAWDQISGSRRGLEQKLGQPVTTFCYPNGKPGDYSPEQVEMVRRAGFVCATASHIGWVSPESSRFALPRIGGDGGDMARFCKYLDGFEYYQRRAAGEGCESARGAISAEGIAR